MITCHIRYTIDPGKAPEFEQYARLWIPLVEKFGGTHHGYFLPSEGANNIAVALFSFATFADYEIYRNESSEDPECQAAYHLAESTRCIVHYERSFLRPVVKEPTVRPSSAHPLVDPTAFIAPNAFIDGDVTIGPGCRIMHGAQVIAESGSISIGKKSIVLENAVLRSSDRNPLQIGDHCLIGPHAHIVGCTIEDEVFIATGASVFHRAHLGRGCEVRINGVVHIRTRLPEGTTVPIGHIAVGEPARVLEPGQHEEIWKLQEPLDFPSTVYGYPRSEASMRNITERLSSVLAPNRTRG